MAIARAAWNILYNQVAQAHMPFSYVFSMGRSMGLPSYRRALMLGDYNVYRGWAITQSWFKSLSKGETPKDSFLAIGWENQKQKYMYRIELAGKSIVTGVDLKQVVTIHSNVALDIKTMEENALFEYGREYGAENYALEVESATALGGSVRWE